jgi:hypothetical protein
MSDIATVTRSLRTVRWRARLPRLTAALLALILMVAGLRATFAGPATPPAPRVVSVATGDQGAAAFAEGFARVYLTWDAARPADRERRLRPYVAALEADGGLTPAVGTSRHVTWTATVGERIDSQVRLVTVAAQTTDGLVYLSVPVSRSRRGFLSIPAYPAVVGPPATDAKASPLQEPEVDDDALIDVATRAVRNYLAGSRSNLLADLTPDALVSPPSQPLALTRTGELTWVVPSRRVAVELTAQDAQNNTLTLRYELEVSKRDRWYVRSVQVDPAFAGHR